VRLLRPAVHATLALLVASSAGAGGAAAATFAGPRDALSVSTSGVSFAPGRAVVGANVTYRLRSLDESTADSLRVKVTEDAAKEGYVAFDQARDAMPDGYCVTDVHVPNVGEWSEGSAGRTCTGSAPAPTTGPGAQPTSPPPSSPTPSDVATQPAPAPVSTPGASPGPSPSPSAGPSASPSPSPSASPAPPGGPTTHEALAEQGRTLAESFSGELPELTVPGEPDRDAGTPTGIGIVAGSVAAVGGGAAVWWSRRPRD
jgi:hypothetical protein